MNGIQLRKAQDEKQFPGCLGRMVNLFDLGNGVTGNRLLTDKPHNDGSTLSRSCSDVASMLSAHYGDRIGDEMTVSELRRSSLNKRANGTPIKTLIAHEMSKEVDSRRSPPNVVAKLMGLDNLPQQQHSSATERFHHPKSYSRRSLSQSEMLSESEDPHFTEQNDFRDNANERNMALVRQKFIEAKRLATDEKSRESKEFQDALEVLSSNRDIFLKFLQGPHSLFSRHLYDTESTPSPQGTKRITVLKPAKAIDNEKFVGSRKKGENCGYSNSPTFSNQRFEENSAQPTRIVVLKPSPGILQEEEFFDEPDNDVARESSNTMGHRRDETLLSSVFSNGYIGDNDSSFHKTDNGNLSDSEILSPISRHSWDFINRSSSPFSSSSFSRASCSPESSICREAKKRLSERWAMMASNGNFTEQRNARRSSSTLGEMLALSNEKKEEAIEEDCVADSPKSLIRSKSLPVSSTVYGTGLGPEAGKTEISKKPKKVKSSLKGKVSSLFFSRNKKSNKEKSSASQSATPKTPGVRFVNDSDLEDCLNPVLSRPCNTVPTLIKEGVMPVPKPVMSGNIGENQDQPSPVSVLEPPFEEDEIAVPELSAKIRPNLIGAEVLPKSNLIDKSPPIESISRTLSWNHSCVHTATSYSSKPSCNDEEEHDWPLLIQTLLSDTWHSPESPLDPTLRTKFANDITDKEVLHEAERRQRRSNRKLVFDLVNAALETRGTSATMLVDFVWGQMKEWLYREVRENSEDDGVGFSVVVERAVGKEVVGKGWSDGMRVERDSLGIEIGERLLDELVEDVIVSLTSCV